jgi:hypothetical protein
MASHVGGRWRRRITDAATMQGAAGEYAWTGRPVYRRVRGPVRMSKRRPEEASPRPGVVIRACHSRRSPDPTLRRARRRRQMPPTGASSSAITVPGVCGIRCPRTPSSATDPGPDGIWASASMGFPVSPRGYQGIPEARERRPGPPGDTGLDLRRLAGKQPCWLSFV